MNERLENLINLLDIERIEENLFRGESPSDRWQRVFGGQVIGQALVAASRTVENRVCHSLHAYFLRAGDPKVPILYEVDRSRDGRSFTSRRVVAVQNGKKIFNMSASFQIEEDGLNHQDLMPDVDNFDDLPSEYDLRKKIINSVPDEYKDSFNKEWPVEVRPIDPVDLMNPEPKVPTNLIWFRAKSSLPDNVSLHQCVLAYMSASFERGDADWTLSAIDLSRGASGAGRGAQSCGCGAIGEPIEPVAGSAVGDCFGSER